MAMPHSTANWHWKNKNCTSWARSWFQDELVTVSISGEGTEQILVAKVTEVDGDVELGQRKSKLITIYDVKVALEWTGTASDGTDVAGTLTIPEVSHEITVDGLSDYAYEWALSTGSSPAVDALYSLAKKQLPAALEAKFSAFPKALLDTHGRDLTVAGHDSAPASGASTPAPAAAINAAAKNVSVASAAQKVKAINTSDVKTSATFMVEANDFFSLLTDENRIPVWTRAPAKSKAEPGGEYSLFGGGVRGKYVTLEPGKKIVQTWILQSPTWPSGHEATLTTTLAPGSDSTTVTFALAGVPKGMEDEITRNLEGYYIHGFKSIGCVQLFPSPSELSSAPEKSRRELKQETSSAKGSIAIALAGVVLLAAFVPYFLS